MLPMIYAAVGPAAQELQEMSVVAYAIIYPVLICRQGQSTACSTLRERQGYMHTDQIFLFSDCTMTWYAVRRPVDSALTTSTYVAAIMVEDFANKTSMTPMSSVPLQM